MRRFNKDRVVNRSKHITRAAIHITVLYCTLSPSLVTAQATSAVNASRSYNVVKASLHLTQQILTSTIGSPTPISQSDLIFMTKNLTGGSVLATFGSTLAAVDNAGLANNVIYVSDPTEIRFALDTRAYAAYFTRITSDFIQIGTVGTAGLSRTRSPTN